ncbi:MAG: DUF1385 domain-containing protein [Oscillospiraceae bacterium]|jgi:uncharacterized protein YqhQ|nr:DUF1385 domain-containing protein [Oscillospiraceae bacterium]
MPFDEEKNTSPAEQIAADDAAGEILIGAVGGEALMEGIMMRGPKGCAVSLRLPNGSIETTVRDIKSPKDKYKFLGWPLIRGPVNFVDSMRLAYKFMMESAEKTADLENADGADSGSKLDLWLEKHLGPKLFAAVGVLGTILGFGLAFCLFVWLPSFLFDLLNSHTVPDLTKFKAILEGTVRITLFVGYMAAISQLKDIRRVFQYHGAEHKSIFCYESGLPLTVENVRAQSRLHPRCGTSFLFVMLLLGMIVSSIVALVFPAVTLPANRAIWIAIKILQFPVIMSIGYEYIRFAGRHLGNPVCKVLSAPGLAMQRITTKEPPDDVIEVGIVALKAALGLPYAPLIAVVRDEDVSADNSENEDTLVDSMQCNDNTNIGSPE